MTWAHSASWSGQFTCWQRTGSGSCAVEPPCTTFSPAAWPAVRSYLVPLGFDRLNWKTWKGNQLCFRGFVIMMVAKRYNRPSLLEQPRRSKMAWTQIWRYMLEQGLEEAIVASCQFGSPHQKEFRLLCYLLDVIALEVRCPGGHQRIVIQGKYTKASAAYVCILPVSFVELWRGLPGLKWTIIPKDQKAWLAMMCCLLRDGPSELSALGDHLVTSTFWRQGWACKFCPFKPGKNLILVSVASWTPRWQKALCLRAGVLQEHFNRFARRQQLFKLWHACIPLGISLLRGWMWQMIRPGTSASGPRLLIPSLVVMMLTSLCCINANFDALSQTGSGYYSLSPCLPHLRQHTCDAKSLRPPTSLAWTSLSLCLPHLKQHTRDA